jgi:hypothetical protein
MTTARERWNAIRNGKAAEQDKQPSPPQGPQPAGEGSPSVLVGAPGWEKQLEAWGMNPAFDDDDPFDRRVRGY